MNSISQAQLQSLLMNLSSFLGQQTELTLKQYIIDKYLPDLRILTKKEANFQKMLSRINMILSREIAGMQLKDISKNDVKVFLAEVENERGVSKATINRYRARLMAIFYHAIEAKLIFENPVKSIKKNKEIARSRYLSDDEMKRLIAACKSSRNNELYYIVLVALNTGLRAGEILNLRHKNIINDSIKLLGSQTKTGLDRIVPLNSIMRVVIQQYISNKNRIKDDDYLFETKSVRYAFEYALKRAGIKEFRFHDLRRTFATRLKDKNASAHSISKLLGHTNLTTTERYLGYSETNLLDTVELLM